jgi:hypothetical protein
VTQVAAVRTPCSDQELEASLSWAFTQLTGFAPSDATLAILCAHVALETGHMASMVCFNPGNYKRGPGPDYCTFQTFEYVGNPPVKTTVMAEFSAWPDFNSAFAFYVGAFSKHWPEAWAGALAGDADAFCAGLKARGYYSAPEQLYSAGVKRWQAYYSQHLGGDTSVTQPDLSDLGPSSPATLPEEATTAPSMRGLPRQP